MARILITGGCGFIGSNLSDHLIRDGEEVVVFDNLHRKGSEKNLKWLQQNHSGKFTFIQGDIRDYDALKKAMDGGYDVVCHAAGQVAVTTSVLNPREDFEINALGTFNLLEAIRESKMDPAIIFTSTNKVYGCIEEAVVIEQKGRYAYRDYPQGMDENRPLDFHSPYGCSKGTAEQYVRDYARIYGMRSVVFRMSCQYGIRQFGNEDQGWVVHFVIAAHFGKNISIYGDGKQVRDLLYIDDLVRAFRMAIDRIDDIKGQIFNIGGGPDNAMSLLELVAMLEEMFNRKINLRFSHWRPGDQKVYVSKIDKARETFGWEPTVSKSEGLEKLCDWVQSNEHLFEI
jgi:CDP-paratose 2-epimerase